MHTRWLVLFLLVFGLLIAPASGQDTVALFGDVIFALDVTLDSNEPIFPLDVFPFNIPVIVGFVDVENLPRGAIITTRWLLADEEKISSEYVHQVDEPDFRLWTPLSGPNGIEPGIWTLRFQYLGEVVAEKTVEVTTAPFVFPIRFGTACGTFTGEMLDYAEKYEGGVSHIFAQIRYANFPQRTPLEGVWFFDGEELEGPGLPTETTFTANGQRCLRIGGNQALPAGTYELQLREEGLVIQSAVIEIGD